MKHLALLLTFTFSSTAIGSNLVVNGDFEAGNFTAWNQSGGMLVAEESAFLGSGGFGSFPGNGVYVASFSPGSFGTDGVLSQSFSTVPGKQYLLEFDYGNFGSVNQNQQSIEVAITDESASEIASLTVVDSTPTGNISAVFDSYELDFTATSSSSIVVFRDLSSTGVSVDGLLDNVVIDTVPEPASASIATLGILAGLICRIRIIPL